VFLSILEFPRCFKRAFFKQNKRFKSDDVFLMYLSVGKVELGSALSEGAGRDKSLALVSRRSAQRLRLSTVSLSV
jgi:hypothetical protein